MDGSIKDRIIEFCKVKGMSIRQFEIQCKMSNGYISSMRKGLGEDKLNNVLNEYPDLSRNWLLYGDGDMFNTTYHRIKVVLEREGYTEEEFAKGVSFWFPGVYKKAKKNPGDVEIAKDWVDSLLKLFPKYSRQWLLYGDGNMYSSDSINNASGMIINGSNSINNSHIENRQYYSDSPDVLRAQIDVLEDKIAFLDAQIKEKDTQINKLIELLSTK